MKTAAWVVGAILIIIAIIYFMTPANALPVFMPGHDAAESKIHFKHGIGALFLGLAAFAYAWFQGGKKKSASHEEE